MSCSSSEVGRGVQQPSMIFTSCPKQIFAFCVFIDPLVTQEHSLLCNSWAASPITGGLLLTVCRCFCGSFDHFSVIMFGLLKKTPSRQKLILYILLFKNISHRQQKQTAFVLKGKQTHIKYKYSELMCIKITALLKHS